MLGPDQLELAVSGLSGMVGATILPTLSSWLRVVLQWAEHDRPALVRGRRLSGWTLSYSAFTTFMLVFFVVALVQASAELREIRQEAPVFEFTITGILFGLFAWAIYMGAWNALMRDLRRRTLRNRIYG